MTKHKTLAALSLAAMMAFPAAGFSQSQPDPHHAKQNGAATTEVAPAAQGQQDAMMNMMAGMMKMMAGGAQTGMGGMDIQSMGMTERIEGRIAFLRAELNITAEQAKAWDAFADALRKNAKGLTDANMPMMASGAAPALVGQLEAQERTLSARLDGVKAMKVALAPLYDALSAEQRKTADELLAPHMGLAAGGMAQGGMGNMMQGGMTSNQANSK